MAIEIIGSSGKKQDPNVIKQVLKYGEVTEKQECDSNGEHNIWSYNKPANRKDLEEDLENGGEKGWIRKYILKYKNAIWTVTITGLGILGYFGISSIVKYINDTENKLRTVMSEGGGGEQASMDMVSTTETFSNDVLNDQRTMAINNIKQYLKEHPMDANYKQLEKIVRTLCIESPDKRGKRIQYLQDYFPNLLGDTYVVGYSNLESQTTEQM